MSRSLHPTFRTGGPPEPPPNRRPTYLQVRAGPEGGSSVEALRSVADRIRTDSFVLLSGDVVTEVRWQLSQARRAGRVFHGRVALLMLSC